MRISLSNIAQNNWKQLISCQVCVILTIRKKKKLNSFASICYAIGIISFNSWWMVILAIVARINCQTTITRSRCVARGASTSITCNVRASDLKWQLTGNKRVYLDAHCFFFFFFKKQWKGDDSTKVKSTAAAVVVVVVVVAIRLIKQAKLQRKKAILIGIRKLQETSETSLWNDGDLLTFTYTTYYRHCHRHRRHH